MSEVRNHVERSVYQTDLRNAYAIIAGLRQQGQEAQDIVDAVRKLHQSQWMNCINACCSGEECINRSRLCSGCDEYWPCVTARLVYTSDELGVMS